MVENLGPKGLSQIEEQSLYGTETHMRSVLDVVLNQSYSKFGIQNGRGRTYEALLTVSSIAQAQRYYDLLKKVKAGEDKLKINEEMHKALPDFPKFAITYSVSENEEASKVNQDKMKKSLKDYNDMFGTSCRIENINAYNGNLNERLARKKKRYLNRSQQLDLVIVVDRLLTGFDAPCLSILFMDRQPMTPQNIIQAFSRTNRLFDPNKQYGQVVTFQSPKAFKDAINEALRMYSRGGDGNPIAEDFETVRESFMISVKAIRELAKTPEDIAKLSRKQKKAFVHMFRTLDNSFAHLKSFSTYEPSMLSEVDFSQEEYEDFAAMYLNVMEELKKPADESEPESEPVRDDYDLVAFSKLRIDFEYIVELLRGFVESLDQSWADFNEADFEYKLKMIREVVTEYASDNQKLSSLLMQILDEIEQDKVKFMGQDVSVIINQMRYAAIDADIEKFADKWFIDFEDVKYEAYNFKDGELANENKLRESANYTAYKEGTPDPVPKFKFNGALIREFKEVLMPEISPLME